MPTRPLAATTPPPGRTDPPSAAAWTADATRLGGDDSLPPYPSMPLAYTQPARLAALAALFGLAAPEADTARVLEIGCAAGGNIVPLAARFPQARFLGIDVSPRNVEDARRRIAALNLDNVQVRRADLAQLSLAGQRFDYVICHSVFSWAAPADQDAVLRLCQETLAPNGVATISYNVLPGWHLRSAVRDLCRHHAGEEGTPQRRIARARAALERIAAAAREGEAYGLLLRQEAERLRRMPTAYLLAEFLAPHSTPFYVTDFAQRAAQHELDYLCEGDLAASVPQVLSPTLRGSFTAMSGANPVMVEQQIDFLTGRAFRRSVLTRKQGSRPWRVPRPDPLRRLHVTSALRPESGQGRERAPFRDERARIVTADDVVVHQALMQLARAYPSSLPLESLLGVPRHDLRNRLEAETRITQALLALVQTGQAIVSTLPFQAGNATAERPRAWHVARLEAEAGQPWLTNLQHAAVPVTPLLKTLLPHLDGSADRTALRQRLADALRDGAARVPELPAGSAPSTERLDTVAAQHLDRTLRQLARHALLEPETA